MIKHNYTALNAGKLYKVLASFNIFSGGQHGSIMLILLAKNDYIMYVFDIGKYEPVRRFLYKANILTMPRYVDLNILKYLKEVD